MKRTELREIIRNAVRETIAEFMQSSMISSPMISSDNNTQFAQQIDPNQPSMDDLSPLEKIRQQRELEKQRQDKVKQTSMDLQITKKQSDYFNQQVRKNKLDIGSKEKELQQLKGARI